MEIIMKRLYGLLMFLFGAKKRVRSSIKAQFEQEELC